MACMAIRPLGRLPPPCLAAPRATGNWECALSSSGVGGTCLLSCALLLILFPASGQSAGRDWTNYVRSAQEDGVFGIEVDNDIPGRYESFLHPEAKLAAIQAVAAKAHSAHNRAFVYIAGLECITANAANTPHSLAK